MHSKLSLLALYFLAAAIHPTAIRAQEPSLDVTQAEPVTSVVDVPRTTPVTPVTVTPISSVPSTPPTSIPTTRSPTPSRTPLTITIPARPTEDPDDKPATTTRSPPRSLTSRSRSSVTRTTLATITSNGVPIVTTTVIVDVVEPADVSPTGVPGKSSAIPAEEDTNSKTAVIAGAVIGAVFGVALLGVLLTAILRWRRSKSSDSKDDSLSRTSPMSELFAKDSAVLRSVPVVHEELTVLSENRRASGMGSYGYPQRNSGLAGSWGSQAPTGFAYAPIPVEVSQPHPGYAYGSAQPSNPAYLVQPGYQSVASDGIHEHRTAMMSFSPTQEDEIEVAVGDAVIVNQAFSDGWATGTNTRTGQFGAFPMTLFLASHDGQLQ
ncbi:hypothetical protein BC832DRAFT_588313 [Gaertneriomyces semiglobifer]|nr:hypothetical protein BC832DRAFT_588313 [Gaertneriomyces semiglobifer]